MFIKLFLITSKNVAICFEKLQTCALRYTIHIGTWEKSRLYEIISSEIYCILEGCEELIEKNTCRVKKDDSAHALPHFRQFIENSGNDGFEIFAYCWTHGN